MKRRTTRTLLPTLLSLLLVPGAWAWQAQNEGQAQSQTPRDRNAGQTAPQGEQPQSRAQAGQPDAVVVSVSVPVYQVTAGAIAANPSLFYGSLVSVTAEVEETFTPHLFTLDEDRIGAGPDVLVLAPRPAERIMPEDDMVTVVGHVRPLISAGLGRDYEWFDPEWLVRLGLQDETRPVIVAASIVAEDGRQLLRQTTTAVRD